MSRVLPNRIFSGKYKYGHVQGIAVDTARGFVYYSFTTAFIKTDMLGNMIGSVDNLVGHLGCITYDAQRNAVYGSLEYKNDGIGAGISRRAGVTTPCENCFYLAVFDVDKIIRENMNAETDGVMKAVYLSCVVDDYMSVDELSGKMHRYGCSGIDGVALGPEFGDSNADNPRIMIAYGIYGDVERNDNDNQVIVQLDRSDIDKYALPLSQGAPHHSGPEKCEKKYFFHTGNTTYGVQNLEYDPFLGVWLVAVYKGKKEQFSNFSMFVIDGKCRPEYGAVIGREGEYGYLLMSAQIGEKGEKDGKWGSYFLYGSTGIAALGDGYYYFSQKGYIKEEGMHFSTVVKYKYEENSKDLFCVVEEQE